MHSELTCVINKILKSFQCFDHLHDLDMQFSFQSQRKAMPKNAQTTAQLYSSHTLVT